MMSITHATIAAAGTALILGTANPVPLGLAILGSQRPVEGAIALHGHPSAAEGGTRDESRGGGEAEDPRETLTVMSALLP